MALRRRMKNLRNSLRSSMRLLRAAASEARLASRRVISWVRGEREGSWLDVIAEGEFGVPLAVLSQTARCFWALLSARFRVRDCLSSQGASGVELRRLRFSGRKWLPLRLQSRLLSLVSDQK